MIISHISYPNLPPPSYKEIARYMKADHLANETNILIDQCLNKCKDKIIGKVVCAEFQISCGEEMIDLGFTKTKSRDLRRLLSDNCNSIVLFAATLGIGIDRLLLKYSKTSPAKALCLQAIGAERTEALCNAFSLDLKEKFAPLGYSLTPRFSPGYGDLPLSIQRDVFSALECEKHLGLTLNDSLLMSPTKSVTAIIGIKNSKENI